jgi:hypothetical protein
MLTSLGHPDLQTSQSVVYQTRPTNLAQLKKTSPTHCAASPECVQRNGQHLTDVIVKK